MQRHLSLQAYVPPFIADWVKERARAQDVSVSIVVRDLLVAAYRRESEELARPLSADPVRQGVFTTVALDALLAAHADVTLRDRALQAYHRRLARLGFASNRTGGGGDEA